MSTLQNPLLKEKVRKDWVDYNGHMNDAAYAAVFSLAVEQLMIELGMDATFRTVNNYTIFTLETHLCYLGEAREGQPLQVTVQLLGTDDKRLHVFFVMESIEGRRLATSEQMLMGMDLAERRPAPFPTTIYQNVIRMQTLHVNCIIPAEAGRRIRIPRR